MRNRICAKLTGEAIALAQHHAAAAVTRWIATEHAKMIAALRWEPHNATVIHEEAAKCRVSIHRSNHCLADQHEYQCAGDYADSDHEQDRARDRIVNERKRHWQARHNMPIRIPPAIRSINTE
jgi:hypothetical protein